MAIWQVFIASQERAGGEFLDHGSFDAGYDRMSARYGSFPFRLIYVFRCRWINVKESLYPEHKTQPSYSLWGQMVPPPIWFFTSYFGVRFPPSIIVYAWKYGKGRCIFNRFHVPAEKSRCQTRCLFLEQLMQWTGITGWKLWVFVLYVLSLISVFLITQWEKLRSLCGTRVIKTMLRWQA